MYIKVKKERKKKEKKEHYLFLSRELMRRELDDQLVVCPLKISEKKEENIYLELENSTRKRETKSLNA